MKSKIDISFLACFVVLEYFKSFICAFKDGALTRPTLPLLCYNVIVLAPCGQFKGILTLTSTTLSSFRNPPLAKNDFVQRYNSKKNTLVVTMWKHEAHNYSIVAFMQDLKALFK